MITLEWLLDRVVVCYSGCWVWAGADSGTGRGGGYPKAFSKGKTFYVHRAVYQTFKGKIRRGYQVDHVCRTRRCVNPDHLEAVRPEINQQRKHKANGTARHV